MKISRTENTETPTLDAPSLGASVAADLEALIHVAAAYQRELTDRSLEYEHLKKAFEKTKNDLIRLHQGITRLREERHSLANKAMRAAALERKLEKVTAERDQLKAAAGVREWAG
jgi:chromosome segregation ATPase